LRKPAGAALAISASTVKYRNIAEGLAIHPERTLLRIGAVSSVLGLALGIVAGAFHGGGGQPNDLQATLPQYAANNHWELVHLGQFVADILLLVGLIALYRSITQGVSATLARLGIIVAVVAEGIYGVNQAVDGVAIKFVAQQWVSAPLTEKADAFRIAAAVRHIEIGTSSLWTLTSGIVLLLFGLAIALGRAYPRSLGWAAIALGAIEVGYSLDLARNGFAGSPLAMATLLMGPWTLVLAVCLWRKARG
jgi:hypothetical protein